MTPATVMAEPISHNACRYAAATRALAAPGTATPAAVRTKPGAVRVQPVPAPGASAVLAKLADVFGERLEGLTEHMKPCDLRVTISWTTDNTDVDLWVIEPDGSKCFYQNTRTKNGGELSQDQTQGYGPERYQVRKAQYGVYQIVVHYFRPNPNLLAGETHVNVTVARKAGSSEETVERHTVILKTQNQQVEVCKLKF